MRYFGVGLIIVAAFFFYRLTAMEKARRGLDHLARVREAGTR